MGLARRVIPVMLVRGRQLVKGRQFHPERVIGHALQASIIHAKREVDELMILDVSATKEGRGPDLAMVRDLSEESFTPLAVGGGVRGIDDAKALLLSGADKVVVGAAGPRAIREISERIGAQAVVASVDHRDSVAKTCMYAQECQEADAGEILLQSVYRDGMMNGYDLELIAEVARFVTVPLIASCGCGRPADALEAIRAGADAVAAGAMFVFSDITPREVSRYLEEQGVEARCS